MAHMARTLRHFSNRGSKLRFILERCTQDQMTSVQSTSPCLHALHCGHFVPRLAVLVCLRVEDLAQQALQPQFYYPDVVTTKRLDITFTTSHQVSQTLRICFLDIFSVT